MCSCESDQARALTRASSPALTCFVGACQPGPDATRSSFLSFEAGACRKETSRQPQTWAQQTPVSAWAVFALRTEHSRRRPLHSEPRGGASPLRAGRAHGRGAAAGRARDAAHGRRGHARAPGGRAAGARLRGVPGRAGAADGAARGHGRVLGLHRAPGARPERHDVGLPLPGAAWLG